jgi:hypothetical protein
MIEHALSISLIVLFLHFCSWDGEIFAGIKKIIPPKGMLYKPIYGCAVCMTMWHGTYIYWIFFHVSFTDWLLTVFTASGFSVLWVVAIYVKDYCKEATKKIKE